MTALDVMLTSPYASEWNYGAPRIEEPPAEETTGIGSTGVGQEFASGAEKGSRAVAEKGGGQFWLHGDRVYKLDSGTSWAIGQGWWTKDMEVIATQADVTVRLQHYFNGVWVTVGTSPPVPRRMAASVHEDLPPPPHLRAENGQVCNYNYARGWRHSVNGDLVGSLDVSIPYISPLAILSCSPFPPPAPVCECRATECP